LPGATLAELESRHLREVAHGGTPVDGFERGFALELLARGLRRLRGEAAKAGRLALFEALEPYLTRDPVPGEHEAIEARTAMRPLVSIVAIRQLRQRFRELIEAELAQTVASGADLSAERETLFAILGAGR
jgi:RNA polymerase sigma-70 factor (ECF subfamily)